VREVLGTYNPPKISENSLWVYSSEKLATKFRNYRSIEYPLYGLFFLVSPDPFTFAITAFSFYMMGLRVSLRNRF
jgi:hypothetical protein